MKLRYMIIGAGGVGGPVGAYLSKSGADTTLIARGKHLAVLQEHGLTLVSGENERESIPVKAIDMDGFLAAREQGAPAPDVIFVCVKGYSLADTVPFIRKAAGKDTVVIPVLNIYGTGRTLQAELPELLVTDGCIYISANRIAPGVIQKHGAEPQDRSSGAAAGRDRPQKRRDRPGLFSLCRARHAAQICICVTECGLRTVLSRKSCGNAASGRGARQLCTPDKRGRCAGGQDGYSAGEQAGGNLRILDALAPTASTSMQRDMEAGKQSEVDGLIYQVVRLAEQYGVDVPEYRKIAEAVKKQTENK